MSQFKFHSMDVYCIFNFSPKSVVYSYSSILTSFGQNLQRQNPGFLSGKNNVKIHIPRYRNVNPFKYPIYVNGTFLYLLKHG